MNNNLKRWIKRVWDRLTIISRELLLGILAVLGGVATLEVIIDLLSRPQFTCPQCHAPLTYPQNICNSCGTLIKWIIKFK